MWTKPSFFFSIIMSVSLNVSCLKFSWHNIYCTLFLFDSLTRFTENTLKDISCIFILIIRICIYLYLPCSLFRLYSFMSLKFIHLRLPGRSIRSIVVVAYIWFLLRWYHNHYVITQTFPWITYIFLSIFACTNIFNLYIYSYSLHTSLEGSLLKLPTRSST